MKTWNYYIFNCIKYKNSPDIVQLFSCLTSPLLKKKILSLVLKLFSFPHAFPPTNAIVKRKDFLKRYVDDLGEIWMICFLQSAATAY